VNEYTVLSIPFQKLSGISPPTLYDFWSKWLLFPRQHKVFSPSSGDFSVSWKHGYLIIGEFSFKGLIKSWWCVRWRLAYGNVFWYFFL